MVDSDAVAEAVRKEIERQMVSTARTASARAHSHRTAVGSPAPRRRRRIHPASDPEIPMIGEPGLRHTDDGGAQGGNRLAQGPAGERTERAHPQDGPIGFASVRCPCHGSLGGGLGERMRGPVGRVRTRMLRFDLILAGQHAGGTLGAGGRDTGRDTRTRRAALCAQV